MAVQVTIKLGHSVSICLSPVCLFYSLYWDKQRETQVLPGHCEEKYALYRNFHFTGGFEVKVNNEGGTQNIIFTPINTNATVEKNH